MKVLFITTGRFISINGITAVILNYYRNMDLTDMQIDFVVPNEVSNELRSEIENNGSKIITLPRKQNPVKYQILLYRIIKNQHYDIVHVHGSSALMVVDMFPSMIAGVKVRIAHSHNTTCSHMFAHKVLNPVFQACCTHRMACGEAAGKWLFGKRKFTVLNNGIDLTKYKYNEIRRMNIRDLFNINNSIVIGHVGHFYAQKNHSFLIEWFAELINENDSYILVLISDGPLLPNIKEKVKALGIDKKVLFVGKTNDVPSYLQAFDIFVLPSLYEGLPVALIEAQASGLPCIVSNKITREVDLTGNVTFLPLDEKSIWVETINNTQYHIDRLETTIACQEKIKNSGYDSKTNAHRLKELYMTFLVKD